MPSSIDYSLMDSDSLAQVDDSVDEKMDTQPITIETLPTGSVPSQVVSNVEIGSSGNLNFETKDQTPNKNSLNSSTFIDGGTGTKLIELVKQYPELFDKTHPLYCNNSHKGVIWSKIAKDLGIGSGKYLYKLFQSFNYFFIYEFYFYLVK